MKVDYATDCMGFAVHKDIELKTHSYEQCQGEVCVVHSPTDHHMKSWPTTWRGDINVLERQCHHGINHPDPDQFQRWEKMGQGYLMIHGCDGCCVDNQA